MQKKEENIDISLLIRKINGDLSEKERILFENWYQSDDHHKAYFDQMKDNYMIEYSEQVDPPDIRSFVENIDNEKRPGINIYRRILMPVAASVMLALGLFFFYTDKNIKEVKIAQSTAIQTGRFGATLKTEDGTIHDLISDKINSVSIGAKVDKELGVIDYSLVDEVNYESELNTLDVPTGGEFILVLSDGSRVWINSESNIKYPTKFNASERVVILEGEAYFEVNHDPSRPFKVISGDQEISVLGTSFNVAAYSGEATIRTTLVDGKVRIDHRLNQNNTIELDPGFQSVFERNTGILSSYQVDVERFTAWKDGRFVFRDNNLKEIIKVLSRWYGFEFFFLNPANEQLTFSGEIKRYENFEKVIGIISKTEEVKIEIKGKTIIIN